MCKEVLLLACNIHWNDDVHKPFCSCKLSGHISEWNWIFSENKSEVGHWIWSIWSLLDHEKWTLKHHKKKGCFRQWASYITSVKKEKDFINRNSMHLWASHQRTRIKKVKFSFDFMLTEILEVLSSEMPLTSSIVLFFNVENLKPASSSQMQAG